MQPSTSQVVFSLSPCVQKEYLCLIFVKTENVKNRCLIDRPNTHMAMVREREREREI